jgi:hypothetical protein
MTSECGLCGADATRTLGDGAVCDDCYGDVAGGGASAGGTRGECDPNTPVSQGEHAEPRRDPDGETSTRANSPSSRSEADDCTANTSQDPPAEGWAAAAFDVPEPDAYPEDIAECAQWMCAAGNDGKQGFAPWADSDHPDATAEDDARWKWSLPANWTDLATAREWAEKHPPTADRFAFILQDPDDPYREPADPFMLVDGDDIRDPDTGEVHPAFVDVLEDLGLTYASVSTSGAGVHAVYRGELPDGVTTAKIELDSEPWGANDDVPEVEFYDGKRITVETGGHVCGTPDVTRPIDAGELRDVLDAHDHLPPEPATPTHRDEYDLEDHDPDATDVDEVATDVRDLFAALKRIDARAVAEQTVVAEWNDDASTSDGHRAFVPTWGRSGCNGTANVVDADRWMDTGGGGYGGPAVLAAIDAGIMRPQSADPNRLTGLDWFEAVEHLRDLGFPIPEPDVDESPHGDDATPLTVLPDDDHLRDTASGWGWEHAARREHARRDDGGDPLQDARDRTTAAIADHLGRRDRVLIEALPALGKSYGAIAAAADTGEAITFLTNRGHREQYEQLREWCDEHGLSHYTLPSFARDCDTANGEHGDDWAETVRDWYRRGATPQEIHAHAEYELDRPLPCQEHQGQRCPYASKWDFDPDDYDVLIGHYAHGHKHKVTSGRSVVFDESPDGAYEHALGHGLEGAVSYWCTAADGFPFDDYTDVLENRDEDDRRRAALAYLQDGELEPDGKDVLADTAALARAPLAVYTILAGAEDGADVPDGWERAEFPDSERVGVFDRETNTVRILTPPDLEYSRAVVALDGTPTRDMWELALGERLNHRQILQDDERRELLADGLNLNLVRTSGYVKPYNSAGNVAVDRDVALLERIAEDYVEDPGVITTTTALEAYADADALAYHPKTGDVRDGPADRVKWYGDVLGSNEFREKRVGAVIGSNHYGDRFIEKWGAYAGEDVARGEGRGADLTYGEFGDRILTHMREHDTLQAAMRFGRDGNGAVVFVHTDTLPEWVPIAGEGRVTHARSDGEKQVLEAARDLEADEWRTAEIAAHSAVDIGERQVFNILGQFAERGLLSREFEGSGYVYQDDELHRASEHGEAELEPVDAADVGEDTAREIPRSSIYTWDFPRPATEPGGTTVADDREDVAGDRAVADGGEPPPEPPG